MTDCIRREAAINKVLEWLNIAKCPYNHSAYNCGEIAAYETCLEDLKSLPAVDVRPVVHGEWEHKVTSSYSGGGATFCSVCGYGYSDGAFFEVEDFDYCPHCGATMKVDRRDIELL